MHLNRRQWYGRWGAAFLTASFIATIVAPIAGSAEDETDILHKLRPDQREYLEVANRDGSARLIADVSFRVLAKTSKPKPSHTRVAHVEIAKRHAAPVKMLALAHPPAPQPEKMSIVPRVIAAVSHPLSAMPDLFVNYGRTFVPTTIAAKPVERPTPIPMPARRDLAWQFAHRYDTYAADEMQAPGVPVRSQVASPFDIRSGPFHGVRAQNGWSAVRVKVSIPCGAAHFALGPGYNEVTRKNGIVDQETGFIYIGGWGAGPHGAPVDAGLQKASAQAVSDDYAFYFKYANNHPITFPIRFPCGGPDPVLELYPVTNSLLVFSITGMTDQHRRRTLTLVQRTKPEDGWDPSGGSPNDGIILKRVVAIAQPPSWRGFFGLFHRDRFANGSYFGVSGPANSTPKIVWRSCQIGRVPSSGIQADYRDWDDSATWHPSTPGVYLDWPPADVSRSTEGACDAVGINLRRS